MNSDKFSYTTCTKDTLWGKGVQWGITQGVSRVSAKSRGQWFNGRSKGDTIESESKQRQDWSLQGLLSQLLIVQIGTALEQQWAKQYESLLIRKVLEGAAMYSHENFNENQGIME